MTPFESFLEFFTQNWQLEIWLVAKLGVLLALFLYFMFSLVVVRQIKLMGKTLNGLLEKELMIGARVLVGLAVTVFVLAVVIL
jgi:uncharacterized protein DUF5657